MELKVKRIHPDAKLPVYGHPGDAGLDLFAVSGHVLAAGETKAVPTGIQIAVPEGHAGLVWDKSGLSLRGVHRLAGVVDAGYRGEVIVVLVNLSDRPFEVRPGMKIAQLLVQPVTSVRVIEADALDDTPRGQDGFGSTGLF